MLAVDTATESCGVCIVADGRVQTELCLNHGETHARHILHAVDAVLSLSRMSLADIDAFAVTKGPGSFTGLRIGISTVKGLAFAAGKPVVGVSSLEILARQAGYGTQLVCPMMDARRKELYWRIYRREGDDLVSQTNEQVGPLDRLTGQIDGSCLFIGNATALYATQVARRLKHNAQWAPANDNDIRPAVLARLAWDLFQQGRCVDAETFVPVYLRKSDAELNRKHLS